MLFKEELETLKKDSLEKIELSKKQIEQLESQLREYTVKMKSWLHRKTSRPQRR